MKLKLYPFLFAFAISMLSLSVQAQNVGDTIKVKTFHYGSNTRDTVVMFPDGSKTYEKIIMRYNMRCKNALVSDQTNRNLGCGEWDYSCNTYIVDSSKVEEALNNQPNYIISNFTGTSFAYTSKPVYDYYQYTQHKVTLNSIGSDTSYLVSSGSIVSNSVLKTDQKAGKSQFIYLASELATAGLSAGNIHSLILSIDNTGGKAGFLKVSIKHTDSTNTSSAQAELNGFTEVFNSEYVFVNGSNRIVFKTPFNWNGTQNILVQFSFTNSLPNDSTINVLCAATSIPMGLTANQIYAADLSNNGHFLLDTSNFSTIKNELTLSFWAFGNANQMPANTSVLYATDNNPANRQLNIHLPFSNNNVYFDCGFAAGGYDRINKAATSQEQGGKWNHWVFTKNASTGVMKIFVNGTLWLSGTGKTKAMNMQNMFLGKDQNLVNNYKGKITDFAIFNKALPDSLIGTLMNKSALGLTDLNSNLVAYYPMNEGSGQSITESKLTKQSAGTNISWTYDRGDKIVKGFMPLDLRPRIEFTRGVYNTTIQTISVRDSIKRNTTYIEKYSIQSKAGIVPLTNDVVKLDSSFNTLYSAAPSKIYNGDVDSLLIIDSLANTAEGTLLIQNMPYYKRFPWYNEIMSFVTPYGIGLDLGASGKSWYYDVSDFAPLLKGSKRIVMTLGGQSQEQNDIEFWFVVGTPPRTVLEFNQIWQGTNRTGSASIGSINNQSRFAAVNVPILAAGKSFKLRSSITGHGSEGEFEANGGPVMHSINIDNDTANKWSIVQLCAFNPIFPQGGTWIYDRQGWCPGQSSLLKETNLSSKLTAGKTASIDYNTSLPQKAGGAYNFQVAHQLVTYGNANFSLDARILEVKEPSDKIVYGRSNPMCSGPKIILQNSGSTPLTSVEFSYWINVGGQKQSYTWTGSLGFLDTLTVNLPIGGLYATGMLSSNNVFKVEILKANGVADGNSYNNLYTSSFKRPEVIPGNFMLDFRTNNNPTESSYELYDGDNKLVDSKTFATANTLYTQTYALSGCYRLVVYDAGEDGLSWWGNTAQGNGFVRFRNPKGSVLKTLPTDFGSRYEYSFTTDFLLSNQELEFGSLINLFPNPSTGNFVLEGKELENASVKLIDLTGRELAISIKRTATNKLEVDAQALPIGVYLVVIEKGNERVTKKVMIQ
ncbi:MAG: hypothetical protein CFE21_10995 [Bacteroidetes bacterium B1(2017)]|nr:MAG: hypothetical protein CFE21_10995 [Bacteroidetes bacterium B1(2017)]